jgi:hypothetical protein
VSCNDGTAGTGDANLGFSFSSAQVSCSAKLQGNSFVGGCTGDNDFSCSFEAQGKTPICLGGAAPGASTGDITTVACKQKEGADTDSDCAGVAGKPRKLDCDDDQTNEAIAAGCTPTEPGDSDVCCPTSVQGQSEDGGGGGAQVSCTRGPNAESDSDCLATGDRTLKLDCLTVADLQTAFAAGCTAEDPDDEGDLDVCCPASVSAASGPPPGGGRSGAGF